MSKIAPTTPAVAGSKRSNGPSTKLSSALSGKAASGKVASGNLSHVEDGQHEKQSVISGGGEHKSDGTSVRRTSFLKAAMHIGKPESSRKESVYDEELHAYEMMQKSTGSVVRRRRGVLMPQDKFRKTWDWISITLIIYNIFAIPLNTALESEPIFPSALFFIERLIDAFFFVDIIVNFNSAVEKEGRFITNRWKVAEEYIKTWFTIDLISCIPWTTIFMMAGIIQQASNLAVIIPLTRMLRVLRIQRVISRLEYTLLITSTVSSLIKFFATVTITSHWFSCIFILIAKKNGGINGTGWEEGESIDKYIAAFYWSIMTMATVGYGDVTPMGTMGRLFSIFAMLIGASIFAYGITNVVDLVSTLHLSETEFKQKMDMVNAYMEARELPTGLRQEIRDYFYHARESKESKLTNEQPILEELSSLLRSKVALAINDHFLKRMPYFAGSDPGFLMEISLSLKMVCYPPFEEVIREGDQGEEMFFIFRGAVEIIRDNKQWCVLGEDQYFGEVSVLRPNVKRTATARTLEFCELRTLTRDQILHALTKYPSMKERIDQMARQLAKSKNKDQRNGNKGTTKFLDDSAHRRKTFIEQWAASYASKYGFVDEDLQNAYGGNVGFMDELTPKQQELRQAQEISTLMEKILTQQAQLFSEVKKINEDLEMTNIQFSLMKETLAAGGGGSGGGGVGPAGEDAGTSLRHGRPTSASLRPSSAATFSTLTSPPLELRREGSATSGMTAITNTADPAGSPTKP